MRASIVLLTEPFREEGRLHGDLFERKRLRLLLQMLNDGGVIDPVDVPGTQAVYCLRLARGSAARSDGSRLPITNR